MPQILIADLDGTIVKTRPARLQMLAQGQTDLFIKNIRADPPNRPTVKFLQWAFQRGIDVHIFSGRPESARAATEEWLWQYNVPFKELLMRPEEDHQPAIFLKRSWLRSNSSYSVTNVFCIFEDQTRTVQMYRQYGFTVFQVNQTAQTDQLLKASAHMATLDSCK